MYIDNGTADVFKVDVWDGAEWQNVITWEETHGDGSEAEYVIIDIGAFANDAAKVRFYYSDEVWDWYAGVDNVLIFVPNQHDLAVVEINPLFVELGESVFPSVILYNNGYETETDLTVEFVGSDGYTTTKILSGQTFETFNNLEVVMDDAWTPSSGIHTLTATVIVTDDANPENNEMEQSCVAMAFVESYFATFNGKILSSYKLPDLPTTTILDANLSLVAGTFLGDDWFGIRLDGTFGLINKTTGEWTEIGPTGMNQVGAYIIGLTFDPVANKFYSMRKGPYPNFAIELWEISMSTGVGTLTATSTQTGQPTAIACDGDGTLHVIMRNQGGNGILYTIDKTDASFTEVGDMGAPVSNFFQDMSFDINGGECYFQAYSPFAEMTGTYLIDTETGQATALGGYNASNARAFGIPFEHNTTTHEVTFNVTDGVNGIYHADVVAISENAITNINGQAVVNLFDGDWTFRVSRYGYEDVTGAGTINGSPESVDIVMTKVEGCVYTVILTDQINNSWYGNYLDVLVDGTPVLEGITLAPSGSNIFTFIAEDGAMITTTHYGGNWPEGNDWVVKDGASNIIIEGNGTGNPTIENDEGVCPVGHDLGVIAASPQALLLGDSKYPTVTFFNYGAEIETDFTVEFSTNGYISTKVLSNEFFAPGAEMTVTMDEWTPVLSDDYLITASVTATNDNNAENNALEYNCVVFDDPGYTVSEGYAPEVFSLSAPDIILPLTNVPTPDFTRGGTWCNDEWYVIIANGSFGKFDKNNEFIAIGNTGIDDDYTIGLAYSISEDIFYAMGFTETSSGYANNLYKINPKNGVAEIIGTTHHAGEIYSIAANANGNLYGVMYGITGKLYEINTTTASLSLVGDMGSKLSGYFPGMSFDYSDGTCYYISSSSHPDELNGLYIINTSNGNITLVGTPPSDIIQKVGFAIPYDVIEITFKVDDGTNPVEGAYIYLAKRELVTGANGEATTTFIEGTYEYTVVAEGFANQYGTLIVTDDAAEAITLTPGTAIWPINITVYGEQISGEPVPVEGADVTFDGVTLQTDENGFVSFEKETGGYDLIISATTYNTLDEIYTVTAETNYYETELGLTTYNATFTVLDNWGSNAPVEEATIMVTNTNAPKVVWEALTDASGNATIEGLPITSYEFSIEADGYETYDGGAFSIIDQNITVPSVFLNENLMPVVGIVNAVDNLIEADIDWDMADIVEFRYDDGVITGQLGASSGTGTDLFVLGASHPYNAILNDVSWMLTAVGGPHTTVNLFIFGLNTDGAPNSNDLLFSQYGIANTDLEWNTFGFSSPVDAPNGFFIGLSYTGYLALGTDDGIGYPYLFVSNTNWITSDYTEGVWEDIGALEFPYNFSIRANGLNFGDLIFDKSTANTTTTRTSDLTYSKLEKPIHTSFGQDKGPKSLQGFDLFFFEEADMGTPENWTTVAEDIGSEVLNYTDNTNWPPAAGGMYYYAVVAKYESGNAEATISNGLEFLSPPPQNLFVNSNGYAIWEEPNGGIGLTGYNVFLDGNFIAATPQQDLFYQYADLVNGQTYMAAVTAVYDDMGESVPVYYEFMFGTPTEFTINLPQGWSGISSYMVPDDATVESIFAPVQTDLIILQNFDGMYWPTAGVNTIGNWDSHAGYQVKMEDAQQVTFTGEMQTNPAINLTAGWNYLPILNPCNNLAVDLFGQISNDLQIVKEIAGSKVYWPEFGVTTLDEVIPGKAYFVFVDEDVKLEFPECTSKGEGGEQPTGHPQSAQELEDGLGVGTPLLLQEKGPGDKVNTDEVKEKDLTGLGDLLGLTPTPLTHSIAFPDATITTLTEGDIIAVFDQNGSCCGWIPYLEKSVVLTAFGNDPTTPQTDGMMEGEPFTFMVFNPVTEKEYLLNVEFDEMMINGGYFVSHGLSAVKSLQTTGIDNHVEEGIRISIYPNPSNDQFKVRFEENTQDFTWEVLNIHGSTIISGDGFNDFEINLTPHPRGIYYLKIYHGELISIEKLVLQ